MRLSKDKRKATKPKTVRKLVLVAPCGGPILVYSGNGRQLAPIIPTGGDITIKWNKSGVFTI